MVSFAIIGTTALFVLLVSAQSRTGQATTPTINPSLIESDVKKTWCLWSTQTCSLLCSGSTSVNTCTPASLDYNCTCASNKSAPGLIFYRRTIPTFICEKVYEDCVVSSDADAASQKKCAEDEASNCGHLDPEIFTTRSTSSSTDYSRFFTSKLLSPTTFSCDAQATSASNSSLNSTGSSTSLLVSPPITSIAATSTSSANSSTIANYDDDTHSVGINPSKKAGIGVGVGIGVILLGLGVLLVRRRKNHRGRDGVQDSRPRAPAWSHPNVAELSSTGKRVLPYLDLRDRNKEGSVRSVKTPVQRHHELE